MRRMDVEFPDDSFDALSFHLARYKFISRLVKPTDRAVEIGCGTGYGARFLSDYVREIVACDADHEILGKATSRFSTGNLRFERDMPNEASAFDVVVCLEVIEHMDKPSGFDLLTTISRLLRDRGVAFISTPRKVPNPTLNRQLHHIHEYEYEEFRETLEGVFARALIFTQIDEIIATHHNTKAWNFVACCWNK